MAARLKTATLEFLGTGTSTGVPIAGCRCEVCRSPFPEDKRLRSSVAIRHGNRTLIIDTGPEFRLQCLRAGVMHVSGVLYTHDHADHMAGLDDVRAFSVFKGKTLPLWGSAATLFSIRRRFDYIWNAVQVGGGLPDIALEEASGPFSAAGLEIIPLPIRHGKLDIFGYRIGDLAYMTDVSAVPESTFPLLENLGTMVISCVRHKFHRTHLSVHGAVRLHERVRPKRTLLTHLTHHFFHRDLLSFLPLDMAPAYDGMRVEICLGARSALRSSRDGA